MQGSGYFVNNKFDLAIDIGGLYLVDFLKKEPVVIDDENEISDMTDYVISFDSLQKMITFLGIKMIRLYAKQMLILNILIQTLKKYIILLDKRR